MVLKCSWGKISFWNNENCQFMHLFQYKQVYLIELHMNFQRIYPSLRRWYIYYIKVDNTFRIKFLQKTESLHVYHTSWQSCFFTIVKTKGVHSVPITKIAQKTKVKSYLVVQVWKKFKFLKIVFFLMIDNFRMKCLKSSLTKERKLCFLTIWCTVIVEPP